MAPLGPYTCPYYSHLNSRAVLPLPASVLPTPLPPCSRWVSRLTCCPKSVPMVSHPLSFKYLTDPAQVARWYLDFFSKYIDLGKELDFFWSFFAFFYSFSLCFALFRSLFRSFSLFLLCFALSFILFHSLLLFFASAIFLLLLFYALALSFALYHFSFLFISAQNYQLNSRLESIPKWIYL